jgi:hypothetical protein
LPQELYLDQDKELQVVEGETLYWQEAGVNGSGGGDVEVVGVDAKGVVL